MGVEQLLGRARGLPDPGEGSPQQKAAVQVARALDEIERVVGVVADALEIIEPLIDRDEARGMVAARLRLLADGLDEPQH